MEARAPQGLLMGRTGLILSLSVLLQHCVPCVCSLGTSGEVWLERGKEAFLWLPKIPVTEKGGSRQPLPLLDAFSMFGIQSLGCYKISSSK